LRDQRGGTWRRCRSSRTIALVAFPPFRSSKQARRSRSGRPWPRGRLVAARALRYRRLEMRCRERDFALEESTNSLLVRGRRRPELDDDEELGQVDATADPGPDRRWLAVLVFEA